MKQIIILISFLSILSSCTSPKEGNKWWEDPLSDSGVEQVVSSEMATVPTPTYWSGKHTIEIFADFQCPACIYFAENVGLAIEWFAEKWQVKIIYRQYPLVSIHKNAQRDALAALCAQEQGKYMEYKKALYNLEKKKSGASVSDNDRVTVAQSSGLDESGMKICLESNRYESQIASDVAYGDSLRIGGTPTIFLDWKRIDLWLFEDNASIISFIDRVTKE